MKKFIRDVLFDPTIQINILLVFIAFNYIFRDVQPSNMHIVLLLILFNQIKANEEKK